MSKELLCGKYLWWWTIGRGRHTFDERVLELISVDRFVMHFPTLCDQCGGKKRGPDSLCSLCLREIELSHEYAEQFTPMGAD